jgi:hypothetical protein
MESECCCLKEQWCLAKRQRKKTKTNTRVKGRREKRDPTPKTRMDEMKNEKELTVTLGI